MRYPQEERNAVSVLLQARKFLFKEKQMHSVLYHVRKLILMLTMSWLFLSL